MAYLLWLELLATSNNSIQASTESLMTGEHFPLPIGIHHNGYIITNIFCR